MHTMGIFKFENWDNNTNTTLICLDILLDEDHIIIDIVIQLIKCYIYKPKISIPYQVLDTYVIGNYVIYFTQIIITLGSSWCEYDISL